MEEKYIEYYTEYYTEILQDWLKQKGLRNTVTVKQGENLPIPLEYFVYITTIRGETALRNLILALDNGYNVILSRNPPLELLISLKKGKGHEVQVKIKPDSIKFNFNATLFFVKQATDKLVITIVKDQIIIDNAIIKSFFSTTPAKMDIASTAKMDIASIVKIDIEPIHKQLENVYQLKVKYDNYKELERSIQSGILHTANLTVTLTSRKQVTSQEGSKYIMNRENNNYKIRKFFSEYLRFDNLIGRVKEIKSEYVFKPDGFLQVKLFFTFTFYSDEEYYTPGGYGYYESSIENICRSGINSSLAKVEQIAEELGINIDNLKDDEVCDALWLAFYDLVDEL